MQTSFPPALQTLSLLPLQTPRAFLRFNKAQQLPWPVQAVQWPCGHGREEQLCA